MNSPSDRTKSSLGVESTSESVNTKKIETSKDESNEINFAIYTQTERIICLLDEIIFKTEIAIVLMASHEEMVQQFENIITPKELRVIEAVRIQSISMDLPERDEYQEIMDHQLQEIVQMTGTKIFPALSQTFWIVIKYPVLKSVIERILQNIQNENEKDPHSNELLTYLDNLKMFKNKMYEKLSMSAEEKLKKMVVFRNLIRSNKNSTNNIAELSKTIENVKCQSKQIFDEKQAIIKKYQDEINDYENKCKEQIAKIIIETEDKMEKSKESHLSTVNVLTEKFNESEEHYEKLLQEHMEIESELRGKRIDLEGELLTMLKNYDKDVGGKQNYLDELTKHYQEEEDQYNNLKKRFDDQEAIYIPMMAEKQADYEREIMEKMKAFLREHAARVLQRAWRKILAARAEKKKKKGGGKKKKGKKKKGTKLTPMKLKNIKTSKK